MAQPQGLRPLTAALSALRLHPALPTAAATRSFTTTPRPQTKTLQAHKIPPPLAPAYPPGERPLYKQSNAGLYAFARIRFGNNVSGRNRVRTVRTWRPNIHRKKLWSQGLGAWVKTKLTTRVLRTIKKEGGLDEYLVGHGKRRVEELGPAGWRLRWLVMQTDRMQQRFAAERERLGVEGGGVAAENAEEDRILRGEKVQIAMDYATPGGLSRSTRDILERRRAEMLEVEYGFGEGSGGVEFNVVELEEEMKAEAGAAQAKTE